MSNTRDVPSTTSSQSPSPLLSISTAIDSLSSVRPVTVPSVDMPLGHTPTTVAPPATIAAPTAAPTAAHSAAPIAQTLPVNVTISVATTAPPAPKNKQVKKGKGTLALTPEEFEKENIRVERVACRFEMNKLATEKKDLSETVKIFTTRCRLFEEERNTAATKNAAPNAIPRPASTQVPTVSNTPGNSSLETLINLKVLKAVKSFSPGSDPTAPPKQTHSEFSDCSANDIDIKHINENLQCILDNQKFLYERFQSLSSTIDLLAKAQTEVKESTFTSTHKNSTST